MATFQLLLRNKKNKSDRYPVIFKVYLDDKSSIITLPFTCARDEWDEKNKKFKKKYPKYKEINEVLRKQEIKLQSAIDDLETQSVYYSLDDIRKAFKKEIQGNRVKRISVNDFILKRIEELEKEKRFGYAKTLKDTYASLLKFVKSKKINFKDITPEFLYKYETFLRESYTDGGIAVRMRDIRTIYNRAITFEYAKQENYPFNTYKISKLKKNSRKIALTTEDFKRFKKFDTLKYKEYMQTYQMFLFSYYTGGMNFKDLMYLKWENVKDDRLVYKRKKTKGNFNLEIKPNARKVLQYFKNNPSSENEDYVFPIIHKYGLTEKQINGRYKRCIKKFNKQLKFIAETQGINKNITSYVSRHSFATHLKLNGVSEDVICQLMGHSSVAVTKSYLEDFGNEVLDNALDKLN